MGYNRDTFSLVLARDGMKLPAGNLTFLRLKIGSDGCNSCGITPTSTTRSASCSGFKCRWKTLPSEWIANSEAGIVLIFDQLIKFTFNHKRARCDPALGDSSMYITILVL